MTTDSIMCVRVGACLLLRNFGFLPWSARLPDNAGDFSYLIRSQFREHGKRQNLVRCAFSNREIAALVTKVGMRGEQVYWDRVVDAGLDIGRTECLLHLRADFRPNREHVVNVRSVRLFFR